MTGLHALPAGYTARPVTDADLDGVIRLMTDADRALGLEADPPREYLTWIWHIPSTDLERDTRLVVWGAEVAGFAQGTWRPEEGGPLDAVIRTHPDHRARGIGSWMLAWGEALAAERGTEGIRAGTADRDVEGQALLTSRGYVKVRSFYTMGKALAPGEDAGSAPTGVTIRAFQTGRDERALYQVHEASFADHWEFRPVPYGTFEADMYEAEDWDPSLAFLAEVDGQVAGLVVGLSFEGEANVAVLGVTPRWRGRGIAKALLRRSFAALAERGHHEVRLGVDAQNATGAVALYERVGMTPFRTYAVYDLGTREADSAVAQPVS